MTDYTDMQMDRLFAIDAVMYKFGGANAAPTSAGDISAGKSALARMTRTTESRREDFDGMKGHFMKQEGAFAAKEKEGNNFWKKKDRKSVV